MKLSKRLLAVSLAAWAAMPACAVEVVLDFEGVTGAFSPLQFRPATEVAGFYNGGFSTRAGSDIAQSANNVGIAFSGAQGVTAGQNYIPASGVLGPINVDRNGDGNFWIAPALNDTRVQNTSPSRGQPGIGETVMSFAVGQRAILGSAAGFTDSFSFDYSSLGQLNISVWATNPTLASSTPLTILSTRITENRGVATPDRFFGTGNGTGSVVSLDEQWDFGCNPSAGGALAGPKACNWTNVSVNFGANTTAKWITFGNVAGESDGGFAGTAIDNIRLYNANPVPEPSAYALMALGLLGIGFMRRRQMRES